MNDFIKLQEYRKQIEHFSKYYEPLIKNNKQMSKTTAFTFQSKNLGQAFKKELEQLGYEYKDYKYPTNMLLHTENRFWYERNSYTGYDAIFELESEWRQALEHLKPSFKEGDWVIVEGYHKDHDGQPLKITRIYDSKNVFGTFCNYLGGGTNNFDIRKIKRKATPEEIAKANKFFNWNVADCHGSYKIYCDGHKDSGVEVEKSFIRDLKRLLPNLDNNITIQELKDELEKL